MASIANACKKYTDEKVIDRLYSNLTPPPGTEVREPRR